MFPRMNITAPLTPFAYCPPQYGAGVGIGAITPTVSYMASPYMSSPLPVPYPVIGPSPYAYQSAIPCPPGVIPIPPGQIGAGIAPWFSPLSWSPYAAAQSMLPIRPLITAQPDPVQMAAMCGVMAPPVVDPYSAMAQASLTSPLAVS